VLADFGRDSLSQEESRLRLRYFRVSTSGVEKLLDIGDIDVLLPLLLFDGVAWAVVQLIVKSWDDEETSVSLCGLLKCSSDDLFSVDGELIDMFCLHESLVDWAGDTNSILVEEVAVDDSASKLGFGISTVISV